MSRQLFVLLPFLLVATPAAAQSEAPAFSVSAGGGIAFPFHSDYPSTAFDWHASVRTRATEHVFIEAMYDEWRGTTTSVTRDVTFRGPSGALLGHADELRVEDANRIGLIGVSVLGTGAAGRVRLSAGGGASVMTFRSTYSSRFRGCTSTTPGICRDFTNTNSEATLAVQAVADVEVAITSHVSAFGRALLAGPPRDPAAGHMNVVGGVRVSFR